MTIEEFGKTIKEKHPQYRSKTDREIGEAMLQKYPQYQSKITGVGMRAAPTRQPVPTGIGERLRGISAGDIAGQTARGYGQALIGGAKGLGSTLSGLASLGQRGLERTVGAGLRRFGIGEEPPARTAGEIAKERFFTPEGAIQRGAFAGEQLAEWMVPSAKVAKLERGMRLPGRMATEAGVFGGISAAQKGEVDEETKTAALIGAAFPVLGAGMKVFGREMVRAGEKIQKTVIRPSKKDIKFKGFDIKNVTKHDIGGNLSQVLAKTTTKMNTLGKELKTKLAGSKKTVDLNDVYKRTVLRMSRRPEEQFGGSIQIASTLKVLKKEINKIAKDGIVSVPTAQTIKRKAGENGSWAFGVLDREGKAKEQVYTTFYGYIKRAIEKSSPKGVREINKQLSEIIPIHNSVISRIPVNDRNQAIGLLDTIGLTASIFDPKGLALVGARRLSASGRFGRMLTKAGQRITTPRTAVGERFVGGELKDLRGIRPGLTIEDVTKKQGLKELPIKNLYTDIKGGGITYNIPKAKNMAGEKAFAVSVFPNRASKPIESSGFSKKDVAKFIEKNFDLLSDKKFNMGGWVDEGKVYLDISKLFTDKKKALQAGKEFNQLAITDLYKIVHDFKNAFVGTGGTGEIVKISDKKIFEILKKIGD